MDLLNSVMNKVDSWSQKVDEAGVQQNWAKRHILTRVVAVGVGAPLEVIAVVDNIISAPFHAVGAVCKLVTKSIRVCSSAEILKKIDESLPGPAQFLKTVLRIGAYAIGTIFTLILGFISPSANFRLHCAVPYLELATSVRESKIKAEWQQKLEVEQQKRAHDEAQAEEVMAAVAALLEKAEYEAEREADLIAKKTEEKKSQVDEDVKVITQKIEAKVKDGETIIEKTFEEILPSQAEKTPPSFLKRFFSFGLAEGCADEPVPAPIEVPATA